MNTQKAVFFTQPGCPSCGAAREYLLRKGIDLDIRDVSVDEAALEELTQKYQSWGTPTIVIGSEVIVGFDQPRIDAAIAAWGTNAC
jgi:glutaredoxin